MAYKTIQPIMGELLSLPPQTDRIPSTLPSADLVVLIVK
jgi:hypothetical protein